MATSGAVMSFELDDGAREKLRELAAEEGRSTDLIVCEAIQQYALRRVDLGDAVRNWEQYRQTGLHVSGEEMDAWFEAVERGEDTPVPECHV